MDALTVSFPSLCSPLSQGQAQGRRRGPSSREQGRGRAGTPSLHPAHLQAVRCPQPREAMPGSPGGLNPGGAVGREGQGGGAATGCSWLHSQGCHDRRELFDVPAPDAFPAAASSQGLVGAGARPVWGLRGRFPGSTSLGQPGLGWSLGETERGGIGQEAPLHRCSLQLPCFSKSLGL